MEVLATQNQQNQLPQERAQRAEAMIDWLFGQLKGIFPGWRAAFETEADYVAAKQTWLRVLICEKITRAQLKTGLRKAELSQDRFLPSVGLFVSWCQFEDYHALGLPTAKELIQRYKNYMGYARFNQHEFKYQSKAEYWVLKTIYNQYWNKPLDDTLKAIPRILDEAAEKVRSGFEFEDVPKMIEQKIVNLPQEKTLQHIAKCKAALKGQVA